MFLVNMQIPKKVLPKTKGGVFINSYLVYLISYLCYLIDYLLLPIAYCLLLIAYCLLPIAYCLLPTAYSLLPKLCSRQRYAADSVMLRQRYAPTALCPALCVPSVMPCWRYALPG